MDTIGYLRSEWFRQIGDLGDIAGPLFNSYERLIDWCEKQLSAETGDVASIPHCVVEDGEERPCAIVEITDACGSKDPSLKLLSLHLEPQLALDYREELHAEDLLEPIRIMVAALNGAFRLTVKNGVDKLKVYGRTEEVRGLFDSMIATQEAAPEAIKIYRQSKWLVIERKRMS